MHRAVIGAVVLALAVTATSAPAAPGAKTGLYKGKTGLYKGKTDQPGPGNKISFTIDGKKVKNIKIKVAYACSDETDWKIPFEPSDTKLNKKGKFTTAWAGGLGDNALLSLSGKVKKKGKASGLADFSAVLLGGATCHSGKFGWKATKK